MFSHHRWQIRFQMSPMQQLSIKKTICLKEHKGNKKGYIMSTCVKNKKFNVPILVTGTCFIQKIYAYMPPPLPYFKENICPSPLRLNIFRLFVILSLTQLYRCTPKIFLFTTATFKFTYPLRRIGHEYQRT